MGGDCTCIEATLLGICSVAKRFPMALYVAGDISRDIRRVGRIHSGKKGRRGKKHT